MKNFSKDLIRLIKNSVIAFYVLLVIPNVAFATTTVVGQIIGYACEWLSGEIGIGLGMLVIIISGFQMLEGHIDAKALGSRAIGVGMIVGGAYIGTNIFHLGGA
jgi:type IV secretory pathway VirB2 component (pilin)